MDILIEKDTDAKSMKNLKKTLITLVCLLLIFSFVPVTGCNSISRYKRKRADRKEENNRSFTGMHQFREYYDKEIQKTLKDNDKQAFKKLFAETVIENTYDMNEGLDYVFGLEDWSEFSFGADSKCSSRKEYGGEGDWEFVNCHSDLTKGDDRYRIFYGGYSFFRSKIDGKKRSDTENLGIVDFVIVKLNSKGEIEGPVYNLINGIYHPGREKLEILLNTVINTFKSKDKAGSYIDTMTDEAIGSMLTDNLNGKADKNELKALYYFIRLGSVSKKHDYFFFLNKKGDSLTHTCTVRFKLNDHCLAFLFKNDKLDGASFSEDAGPDMPSSGEIKGFAKYMN